MKTTNTNNVQVTKCPSPEELYAQEMVNKPSVPQSAEEMESVAAETVVEAPVVAEPPKRRGRPPGSKSQASKDAERAHALNQLSKLQARRIKLLEELAVVDEKIAHHSSTANV